MMHAPNKPSDRHARRRARLASRSARSRGAVIVLALLGAFMMAGMIGYVFNTGRHAQLRQKTQHTADAVAVSGAGYVARSFNTVAMNNVEISRLIAVVQMLDAVPLAVEYTLLDVLATLERVEEQQSAGVCPISQDLIDRLVQDAQSESGDSFSGMGSDLAQLIRQHISDDVDDAMEDSLDEIEEDLNEQVRFLEDMDYVFNQSGFDVRELTFYDSEFGRGELWKAMESLDAINTATMEQLDYLTQATAIETGERNLQGEQRESLAAIAPFSTGIRWQRYDFDDFREPVVEGRLPDASDDPVTNRGPYDTIFGWVTPIRPDGGGNNGEENPVPDNEVDRDRTQSEPGSPWSGGGGGRGGGNPPQPPIAYDTFGTWQWLCEANAHLINRPSVLHESQYVRRVNRMGGNKLNDLWPGSASEWVFLDPQWITSYDQAVDIIEAGTPRVAYTQFIRQRHRVNFVFFPYDNTLLEAIGESRQYIVGDTRTEDWDIIRPRGGWTSVPGISEKTCDHVWDDGGIWQYESRSRRRIVASSESEKISLVNRLRGNGAYTLYKQDGGVLENDDPSELAVSISFPQIDVEVMVVRFIWAGMNVGPVIEIRNPNPSGRPDDLPAPIDFDHDQMPRPDDWAVGRPGSPFTFLGLTKLNNRASMWPTLYSTSAHDGHVGIAQASVFNNHSWDLWTQMWHAQLEPVQDYDGWVGLMRAQLRDAGGHDDLSTGELEELVNYLESLRELAPVMLNH